MSRYLDQLTDKREWAIRRGDHAAQVMLEARIAQELARLGAEVSRAIPAPQPHRTTLPAAELART